MLRVVARIVPLCCIFGALVGRILEYQTLFARAGDAHPLRETRDLGVASLEPERLNATESACAYSQSREVPRVHCSNPISMYRSFQILVAAVLMNGSRLREW